VLLSLFPSTGVVVGVDIEGEVDGSNSMIEYFKRKIITSQ
jgi:hypothetical protein